MNTAWNPQGDFALVAQQVETVQYEDPLGNPTTITHALPVEQQDEAADGATQGLLLERRRWLVPQEQLPQPPQPGGRVLRGSQSWSIFRVTAQRPAGTYRLDARGWRLHPAGQHTVELLSPQWASDALGGATRSWTTTASGLAAQIQREAIRPEPLAVLMRHAAHYRILIETSLTIQPGQRIRDDLNRSFDVVETSALNPDEGFQLLRCVLRN